jgi:hypothetical protein
MKINQREHSSEPPKQAILAGMKSQSQDDVDKRSSVAQVPIDETDAIGVKISPTFGQDNIQSVTLKSFRKVVGYDTFNSILKKDRDEKKDPSDYYNVTVSLMVQRKPKSVAVAKSKDAKTLAEVLDKGFPYDDADINVLERARPALASVSVGKMVGQLDGHNITK